MNYFMGNLLDKEATFYLELGIAIVVCLILVLTIVMLTIIKKSKDK